MTEADRKNHNFYNKDAAWKMVTGEEKMPGEVFLRKSHGLTFVGAHWKHQHELGAFLEAHAAEIPSDRPVIYVQHPHPKGTCFHGWATVDDGRNLAALLAHPNFFCVSGHSHVSVSFDDSLWLGGFAAMGAGSMRIAGGRRDVYNFVRKGGKETRHMPTPPAGGGQQASILSVYPDHVVVSRHEYRYDEPLGEDVRFVCVTASNYGGIFKGEGAKRMAECLRVFADEANYPIAFHCAVGADRTGSLAFVLEALLGVSAEDRVLDWELTAFANPNPKFAHAARYDKLTAGLAKYPGATDAEKAAAYAKSIGVTDAEIATIRRLLLK